MHLLWHPPALHAPAVHCTAKCHPSLPVLCSAPPQPTPPHPALLVLLVLYAPACAPSCPAFTCRALGRRVPPFLPLLCPAPPRPACPAGIFTHGSNLDWHPSPKELNKRGGWWLQSLLHYDPAGVVLHQHRVTAEIFLFNSVRRGGGRAWFVG